MRTGMDKLSDRLAARCAWYEKALIEKPTDNPLGTFVVHVPLKFNGDPAKLVAAGLNGLPYTVLWDTVQFYWPTSRCWQPGKHWIAWVLRWADEV